MTKKKKQFIVIHHTVGGDLQQLLAARQYHCIITPVGVAHYLLPWDAKGAATKENNSKTINIAFHGRFDLPGSRFPTDSAFDMCIRILRDLRKHNRYGKLPVVSHSWIGRNLYPRYATICCGNEGIITALNHTLSSLKA